MGAEEERMGGEEEEEKNAGRRVHVRDESEGNSSVSSAHFLFTMFQCFKPCVPLCLQSRILWLE